MAVEPATQQGPAPARRRSAEYFKTVTPGPLRKTRRLSGRLPSRMRPWEKLFLST
jgi:hypothetical protein